ncbi:hypothetical protein PPSC2_28115 (plasmid) [Paenibacillus polymyxa SC2]|uniref:Uncharacterized protein n=1 Tax=Paenibacillus polymyxa (strain SC2) TaxID=886882 RepID=A0A0D5ZCC5_PAEPS|nr:hypothetical protein PPSC2_28115 [Paenibacillus polymyxa SC2]
MSKNIKRGKGEMKPINTTFEMKKAPSRHERERACKSSCTKGVKKLIPLAHSYVSSQKGNTLKALKLHNSKGIESWSP